MNDSTGMTISQDSVYGYSDKASLTIRIRLVVMPVIFIVGFLGNTLTASVFLGKSLREKSCSIYLAVKAISDNGFLVSLLVAWLDFVDVRIFHTQVVCHVTLYLSYVCGFVSVWSVVMVTIENYVRICRPSDSRSLCSRYIAKRITILGVVFGCMLYNYPLWTMDISPPQPPQQRFCHTLHKFERFEVVMTYVDTILTLVIPLVIIIILICIIAVSLVDAAKRRDRLRKTSSYSSVNSTKSKIRPVSTLPHSKVTKMLLSVSLVFVCLHTPSHAIRMKATLENILGQTSVTSHMDRVLQHFFLVLYYFNFSIYFFIYILCGQNFRKILKKKVNQLCKRKEHVARTSDSVLNYRTVDIELETSNNTLDMD